MDQNKLCDGENLVLLEFYLAMLSILPINQAGVISGTIIAAGILVLIGIIVIMVVGALLFFLPAAVVAGVVWFLTSNELYAAVAFLIIALLSLTRRK